MCLNFFYNFNLRKEIWYFNFNIIEFVSLMGEFDEIINFIIINEYYNFFSVNF